ncbi:MAG TPA: DUF4153 domain-containing protein [Kiritimatiellia bacterium]|nr:DUF4153 domain-containing protein [Kiritimatiellia bacterium]
MSIRRFPLALLFSLLALAAAVALHRQHAWGIPDDWSGTLVRILLLWPFALFGNVGWTLQRERDGRPALCGLLAGGVLLFAAYWVLPAHPQHEANGFWFRYFLVGTALLIATSGYPARRTGHPDLWDCAWPIALAAFMAMLSAMLVVGGVSLALVSMEKLFDVNITNKLYFDFFLAGFFLLAPITAFAWLPPPFGQRQSQPPWLKGTARIVLTPLCLLYALIMMAYIGKITLSTQWPDGWVAMPTLIFGALGLTAYFIARPARDRDAEPWAMRFCQAFPLVLLPLAVVLILAMRIRITDYGFTEWRVIGMAIGLWFLLFAVAYSVRPRCSPWWIACSLGLCCLALGIGPLSAPHLSLNSQRARLDTLLTAAGVNDASGPVTIDGDEARRIQSGIDYLLQHHGPQGLPGWVQTRWSGRQRDHEQATTQRQSHRRLRHQTPQVLHALDVTLINESQHMWYRMRCELADMPLNDFLNLTLGQTGQTNSLPFRVEHDIRVFTGNTEIARTERESFVEALVQFLDHQPSGFVPLPVERMTLEFSHAGEDFVVIFPELSGNTQRHAGQGITIHQHGGTYLVFRRESAQRAPD